MSRWTSLKKRSSISASIGATGHQLVPNRLIPPLLKELWAATHSGNYGYEFAFDYDYALTQRLGVYAGFKLDVLTTRFQSTFTSHP